MLAQLARLPLKRFSSPSDIDVTAGLSAIAQSGLLAKLDVSSSSRGLYSELLRAVRWSPRLRVLDLSDCEWLDVDDDRLVELTTSLPMLAELYLANLGLNEHRRPERTYSGEGVPWPSSLEKLDFTGCSTLTDAALSALAARCPKLSMLAVGSLPTSHWGEPGPSAITDEGLHAVLSKCPIDTVVLEYLPHVSGTSIRMLAKRAPALVRLELKTVFCTDDAFIPALEQCTLLEDLSLVHLLGGGSTDRTLYAVGQHCKQLKTLNLEALTLEHLHHYVDVELDGDGIPAHDCLWTPVGILHVMHACPKLRELGSFRFCTAFYDVPASRREHRRVVHQGIRDAWRVLMRQRTASALEAAFHAPTHMARLHPDDEIQEDELWDRRDEQHWATLLWTQLCVEDLQGSEPDISL